MKVLYEFWKVIKLVGKFQANNRVKQKLKKIHKTVFENFEFFKNENCYETRGIHHFRKILKILKFCCESVINGVGVKVRRYEGPVAHSHAWRPTATHVPCYPVNCHSHNFLENLL